MGPCHDRHGASGLPLSGRSIVVTRSADQAAGLVEPLRALGAEVVSFPVIEVVEPLDWAPADEAIERIGSYGWIVLTSVNGVERLDARMRLHGLRLADLRDARAAVVGSATAEQLRAFGLEPAVIPEHFRAEGLLEAMRDAGLAAGDRVLLARAEEARELLPDELRAAGVTVDVVPVYRLETATARPEVLDRLDAGEIDAIVFASGGTARRFIELLASAGYDVTRVLARVAVASIGPVTSDALRKLGIDVAAEAATSTSEGLVTAIEGLFAGRAR